MAKLTVREAYEIVAPMHHNMELSSCIDNGKEWGFLFYPIGTVGEMYGGSFTMITKNGRKIYELTTDPANMRKLNNAKQIPVESVI